MSGNAVKLDLPNDMTMYDTANVSRLKVDRTDISRIAWRLPPPLVQTGCAGTRYVVEYITKHRLSSDRTCWEYKVKWEGWDGKDNTWEPDENMAKAKQMLEQYSKEMGRRPKVKRKMTRKKG